MDTRCRLISVCDCGRRWIRTTEGINQQIYSLPHLATLVFARSRQRSVCDCECKYTQLFLISLYFLKILRIICENQKIKDIIGLTTFVMGTTSWLCL